MLSVLYLNNIRYTNYKSININVSAVKRNVRDFLLRNPLLRNMLECWMLERFIKFLTRRMIDDGQGAANKGWTTDKLIEQPKELGSELHDTAKNERKK